MGRATALLVTALIFAPPVPAGAQSTGSCLLGGASADLDVAGVRARMFNDGGFFWHGGENIYEVPKGSGITPIFTTNLWMGGLVVDELRLSASVYSDWEFWPGPLDDDGNPPEDCTLYDRLFSVYDEDIRRYNKTGEATPDMLDWPWDLGAPVFDGDGNLDNYDLEAGDRPYVFGDQTIWWVMNDAGNKHMNTHTDPIGLEIRAAAFASTIESHWIPYTTFYRFELVNKLDSVIDSFYFGVYSEGDVQDHYVGSDSVAGIAYLYNDDEWDEEGYGNRPPALGFTFLQGPLVDGDDRDNDGDGEVDEDEERLRMTSFISHSHTGNVRGWPTTPGQWYGYLHARWPDGTPLTEGGQGYNRHGKPTNWMYSGTPPDYWSEGNPYGNASPVWSNPPQLGTMIMPTGPFRMEPGETQEIIFAIIFSQGNDRLDSVHQLLGAPVSLRAALPHIIAFDTTLFSARLPPEVPLPVTYGLGHYPNPVSESAVVRFELPRDEHVSVVLYDLLGRRVATLATGLHAAGSYEIHFEAKNLTAGLYLYRLETPTFVGSRTLMVVR